MGHTNEQTADFSLQNSTNDWKLHFYVARAQFRLLFEDATMPMWAGGKGGSRNIERGGGGGGGGGGG